MVHSQNFLYSPSVLCFNILQFDSHNHITLERQELQMVEIQDVYTLKEKLLLTQEYLLYKHSLSVCCLFSNPYFSH